MGDETFVREVRNFHAVLRADSFPEIEAFTFYEGVCRWVGRVKYRKVMRFLAYSSIRTQFPTIVAQYTLGFGGNSGGAPTSSCGIRKIM